MSGTPPAFTLVVPELNMAVTHGPFPAGGGGIAHPATTHGFGIWTAGCPLSMTRGYGTVACTWPPCAHITVAPTWTRNGMFDSIRVCVRRPPGATPVDTTSLPRYLPP